MSSRADAILRKSRACLFGAMLLAVFPVARADELSDAQAAEKAGQYARALQLYTAALGKTAPGSGEEHAIIEQAIGAARKTRPAPKAPDAAIPFEGRAEAIAKRAQSPADFAKAADEYRQALRVAPWVSSYAFNAGVLLEKAERPAEAVTYLKLYLLAAPDAPDARDVQKKIAGLEYLAQQPKAAPTPTPAPVQPAGPALADLYGIWKAPDYVGQQLLWWKIYELIPADTNNFTLRFLRAEGTEPGTGPVPNEYRLRLDGMQITGTFHQRASTPTEVIPVTGRVTPDGRTITLTQTWEGGRHTFQLSRYR